jgi:ribose 5-phosphate isomerase B
MTERPVRMFDTVYVASDHAGFELKAALVPWLQAEGYHVVDVGAVHYDDNDDYPDFIVPAALAVARGGVRTAGVILGGSGQGEALAANRVPGVRAVVYYGSNEAIVPLSREHNDANVLSLGARFVSVEEAKAVLAVWLTTTPLSDDKYARRNRKVESLTRPTNQSAL